MDYGLSLIEFEIVLSVFHYLAENNVQSCIKRDELIDDMCNKINNSILDNTIEEINSTVDSLISKGVLVPMNSFGNNVMTLSRDVYDRLMDLGNYLNESLDENKNTQNDNGIEVIDARELSILGVEPENFNNIQYIKDIKDDIEEDEFFGKKIRVDLYLGLKRKNPFVSNYEIILLSKNTATSEKYRDLKFIDGKWVYKT